MKTIKINRTVTLKLAYGTDGIWYHIFQGNTHITFLMPSQARVLLKVLYLVCKGRYYSESIDSIDGRRYRDQIVLKPANKIIRCEYDLIIH